MITQAPPITVGYILALLGWLLLTAQGLGSALAAAAARSPGGGGGALLLTRVQLTERPLSQCQAGRLNRVGYAGTSRRGRLQMAERGRRPPARA